jgi:predicted nucleic acid-binding protein
LTPYGGNVLLDASVWSRALDGRLRGRASRAFETALAAGQLWTCPPSLLELRYGAVDGESFADIADELRVLPHAKLTAQAAESALTAQAELAAKPGRSHRVKPVDLLIAAVADREGLGVLHYDADYDSIATHTTLRFESIWVAPRGSLD